eukprot:5294-Pelagococcus_subviridis.AAC.2
MNYDYDYSNTATGPRRSSFHDVPSHGPGVPHAYSCPSSAETATHKARRTRPRSRRGVRDHHALRPSSSYGSAPPRSSPKPTRRPSLVSTTECDSPAYARDALTASASDATRRNTPRRDGPANALVTRPVRPPLPSPNPQRPPSRSTASACSVPIDRCVIGGMCSSRRGIDDRVCLCPCSPVTATYPIVAALQNALYTKPSSSKYIVTCRPAAARTTRTPRSDNARTFVARSK